MLLLLKLILSPLLVKIFAVAYVAALITTQNKIKKKKSLCLDILASVEILVGR